jgi:hypothetical protein
VIGSAPVVSTTDTVSLPAPRSTAIEAEKSPVPSMLTVCASTSTKVPAFTTIAETSALANGPSQLGSAPVPATVMLPAATAMLTVSPSFAVVIVNV